MRPRSAFTTQVTKLPLYSHAWCMTSQLAPNITPHQAKITTQSAYAQPT